MEGHLNTDRGSDLRRALQRVSLPPGMTVRAWRDDDFPAIQRLSAFEGWPTPTERPDAALKAWRNSWPALVVVTGDSLVGFCRAVSDGAVTMYVAEVLMAEEWRGRGIGTALLDVAQVLCNGCRLDLLATQRSHEFYEKAGFRSLPGYRRS